MTPDFLRFYLFSIVFSFLTFYLMYIYYVPLLPL